MAQSNRSSKGTVTVESFQGRLRLRLPRSLYNGEQKRLVLGLTDTQENRLIAEKKRIECELDIKMGLFDWTHKKYKPGSHLVVVEEPKPKVVPKLDELWQRYTEYKQAQGLEETTIVRDYGKIAKRFKEFPTLDVERGAEIEAHLLKRYAAETAKRTLKALSGCCNWAVKRKLINANPFDGMAREIVSKKPSKRSRKAYSPQERDIIIRAIENDTYSSKYSPLKHSYYASFVKFMFFTGCRPEDAIALKWKHITSSHVIFTEAMATDVRIRKDGKTHTIRMFKINAQLRAILELVKPEGKIDPEALVFPARNGKEIHTQNFLNRVWRPVVQKLVEAGKVRECLPLNNCRHSFITQMMDAGIDPKDIAPLVGNSPETIYKNYASRKADFDIPELPSTLKFTEEDE